MVDMTPKQVRRKLDLIHKHQSKWALAKDELQKSCKHLNFTKKNCGSTGNWDRNDDEYWVEFKCHDCQKFWTEEQ